MKKLIKKQYKTKSINFSKLSFIKIIKISLLNFTKLINSVKIFSLILVNNYKMSNHILMNLLNHNKIFKIHSYLKFKNIKNNSKLNKKSQKSIKYNSQKYIINFKSMTKIFSLLISSINNTKIFKLNSKMDTSKHSLNSSLKKFNY